MFHTRQVVFTVYERLEVAPAAPAAPDGAQTLRARCLHPAEAWALRRRAGRPQAPSRRLPAVARGG